MPKRVPPLTESQCQKARHQPGGRNCLHDGDGLRLLLKPSGAKLWQLKYRFAGKEQMLSFGAFPEVGREAARRARMEARVLLAQGIDPGQHRKAQRRAQEAAARSSFEAVAREWFDKFGSGYAANYASKVIGRLEKDVFPWIGRRPIAEIEAPELLELLRRVEGRGALETVRRERALLSVIFRYAIATARAKHDPAADLRGALAPPPKQRFPTITAPARIGELLRAIHGYSGNPSTCAALRLAPLLFVRPGELRAAEWAEIDLAAAEWRIQAARRKLKRDAKENGAPPHVVPLPRQAVEVLAEAHRLTGTGRFVFPSVRTRARAMSDNTLNAALRRLGFDADEIVSHGFRHMASTLLNERGWPQDWIERQLSHKPAGVRGVYNMAEYMPQRRQMMQAWADYLDALRMAPQGAPLPLLAGPPPR